MGLWAARAERCQVEPGVACQPGAPVSKSSRRPRGRREAARWRGAVPALAKARETVAGAAGRGAAERTAAGPVLEGARRRGQATVKARGAEAAVRPALSTAVATRVKASPSAAGRGRAAVQRSGSPGSWAQGRVRGAAVLRVAWRVTEAIPEGSAAATAISRGKALVRGVGMGKRATAGGAGREVGSRGEEPSASSRAFSAPSESGSAKGFWPRVPKWRSSKASERPLASASREAGR